MYVPCTVSVLHTCGSDPACTHRFSPLVPRKPVDLHDPALQHTHRHDYSDSCSVVMVITIITLDFLKTIMINQFVNKTQIMNCKFNIL